MDLEERVKSGERRATDPSPTTRLLRGCPSWSGAHPRQPVVDPVEQDGGGGEVATMMETTPVMHGMLSVAVLPSTTPGSGFFVPCSALDDRSSPHPSLEVVE
jgi:hypothetical protein